MSGLQATHELRRLNVEVQKIIMLYQGPKQNKVLKPKKNKVFRLSIRKKRGPNPSRVHKEGPKSTNGQVSGPIK